ncbi:MAG: aromatic ring-hydroxylating dioxygenase subunit alpha [Gammaproteobacteria bacterium]|nr:aromatic ring-hydroxylating dioxygenase subunit alpha [Gammaproteobacteria bacterium]
MSAQSQQFVSSLPASWYHDPEAYQRERKLIFARHWSVLAREQELAEAGQYASGAVAGWPVFVVRGDDGELRAFHNVCRHRAGPVVSGESGRCDVLRCPYHGWSYGLDGGLKFAPGFEQDDATTRKTMSLVSIRVATWNGIVFVCLDADVAPLREWLGDIVQIAQGFPSIPSMSFYGGVTNEGDLNWKAYSDNSAEGYHLGCVHKDLSASLVREHTDISAYENGNFVGFRVVYKASSKRPQSNGFWVYKFPGLLLHFSEYGFNLERITPLGPTRSRMERWFWFPDDGSVDEQDKDEAMLFSNRVMDEDLAICLRVQNNLGAGIYQTGRLSCEREPGTVFFQRLVREAMQQN